VGKEGNSSLRYRFQTASEAQPASYPIITGGSARDKTAGTWSWPLPCILCRC